jgi:hypothetical protein
MYQNLAGKELDEWAFAKGIKRYQGFLSADTDEEFKKEIAKQLPAESEDISIDHDWLFLMQKQGGTWACYRDDDYCSRSKGRLMYVQYGKGTKYSEGPPDCHPDNCTYSGFFRQHPLIGLVDLKNGVVITDNVKGKDYAFL